MVSRLPYRSILDYYHFLSKDPEHWQELEIIAQLYLFYQGYSSKRSITLKGTRGIHNIDVVGEFQRGDIRYKIIVECKQWNRKVRKEQVATLSSIMEDIGVSKGIIISKSGFQKGAIKYSKYRSIELLDLYEVLLYVRKNIMRDLCDGFEDELKNFHDKIQIFHKKAGVFRGIIELIKKVNNELTSLNYLNIKYSYNFSFDEFIEFCEYEKNIWWEKWEYFRQRYWKLHKNKDKLFHYDYPKKFPKILEYSKDNEEIIQHKVNSQLDFYSFITNIFKILQKEFKFLKNELEKYQFST